jgi:hypothetical protein
MINKTLLNSSNQGIFNDIIIERQEIGNIYIHRNTLNNFVELHDNSFYPNDTIMIDASDFIKLYLKNIIELNFDSVLFVGLGIGVFPYLCQDTTSVVDVVEINHSIIEICNNIGHLKTNVNIINSDIFAYNTDKKYDLIVFDIWNGKTSTLEQEKDALSTLFSNNLNINGQLHFPILNYP